MRQRMGDKWYQSFISAVFLCAEAANVMETQVSSIFWINIYGCSYKECMVAKGAEWVNTLHFVFHKSKSNLASWAFILYNHSKLEIFQIFHSPIKTDICERQENNI